MAAHYFKTKTLAHTLRALAEIERMKEEQRNEREWNYQEELAAMDEQDQMEADYNAVKPNATSALSDAIDYNSVSARVCVCVRLVCVLTM